MYSYSINEENVNLEEDLLGQSNCLKINNNILPKLENNKRTHSISYHSIDLMSSSVNLNKTDSNSIPKLDNFYFINDNCSSSMYKSVTSLTNEDDPWRASSIGIKCINYRPTGYVFLTRRVMDLYTTDGKRKLDIIYNFSKKFKNKIKTPSIGTSLQNCSFCDTITIDFDPSSTFFDMIMEVQIITQGAVMERIIKMPSVSENQKNDNKLISDIKRFDTTTFGPKSDEEGYEETTIISDYNLKFKNDFGLSLKNEETKNNQPDFDTLNYKKISKPINIKKLYN